MSALILGSVALDAIKTPFEEHDDLLGGSASYAAVSSSFFTKPHLVGIVGTDFPKEHLDYFAECGIDLTGLQIVPGKTFRWSGEYMADMNTRETRSTDLNVFEHFTPILPEAYRQAEFILLGNIAPALQLHVLDQLIAPRFVVVDTMNLWINIAKEELSELLKRIDMLLINDTEAHQLTGEINLIKAGKALRAMGPAYVVIKKGEHGALLFAENEFFSCAAFPLEKIDDPTGAGDAFAGGVIGYLTSQLVCSDKKEIDPHLLRRALVYGSVMASFSVENFSINRLRSVTMADVQERFDRVHALSTFEKK
ncbi:MAG: PfkB family carbohydrate kinase [Chthoniobacterales bacterium]